VADAMIEALAAFLLSSIPKREESKRSAQD
jgi:hypothetical protein